MRAGAFLRPWGVDGDPAAPGFLAEPGLAQVTLAAAHRPIRALGARHPAP
ncbi:hypothetical protein GCM10010275_25820 [Streptomyces litmocidini]|nr:hypothetical protein [Streptomyces litmocidini]GGU88569.1 hypothetical protein GCM10010275_25820 [Streptomyces litmocidini]